MNKLKIKIEPSLENPTEKEFSKCGEVFVAENGRFRWNCVLCGQNFQSAYFLEHVLHNHVSNLFETSENIKYDYASDSAVPLVFKENEKIEENGGSYTIQPLQRNSFNEDVLFLRKYNIRKTIRILLERNDLLEYSLKEKRKKYNKSKFESISKGGMPNGNFFCATKIYDKTETTKEVHDVLKKEETIDYIKTENLNEQILEIEYKFKELNSENILEPKTCKYNKTICNVQNLSIINESDVGLIVKNRKEKKTKKIKVVSKANIKVNENQYTKTKLQRKIEKHMCEICGKESTSKYNLNSHIKLRHNIDDRRKYSCDQCKKMFFKEHSLQNHIKTYHLKEKPFLCNIDKCGKRFVDEKALKNHQAFHTNERKFVCSKCGKKYLHKSKLDTHFKIYHVLGRIHHCKECNKSFYDPYTLRNHMICHSGEKPFVCDECPAKFPRKTALQWHKKVHSGVKDHICQICGQAYHLFTGLYAHMKTHGIKYNKKIEKGLIPIKNFVPEKNCKKKKLEKKEKTAEGIIEY